MLENYRTSQNINEIVKILHKSAGDTKAFLWQNNDNKRYIFEIKDLVVNERFNSFQVKFLCSKYSLYLKLSLTL